MSEPSHLKQGRQKAQRRRRKEAVKRVRAYERWSKNGSDFRTMPAVPSSNDFKLARQQGAAGASHRRGNGR